MRKLLAITLVLLGAFGLGVWNVTSEMERNSTIVQSEVKDLHREQLECCQQYNHDAERTSSIVVPTARTVTSVSRHGQQRTFSFATVERVIASANYPTDTFIHRLSNTPRSVEFYLYMFCQLRL